MGWTRPLPIQPLVDAAPCCSSPNNSPHSYCSPRRSSPIAGSVPRAQLQSNCSQSGCCIAFVANAKQPCSRNSLVREPALLVTKTKKKSGPTRWLAHMVSSSDTHLGAPNTPSQEEADPSRDTLPTHQLLPQVFEDRPRQSLREQVAELLLRIDLQETNSATLDLLTKPNRLG